MKSNTNVLNIVDQYDRNSKCFEIGGKWIQITIEDVGLIFVLPVEGDDFIMNKTCSLKDRGFVKDFQKYEEYHKILIGDALNDLQVEKIRR